MTRTSRFERRILAAIVAVAVVPLLGTLLLGQAVLREAYQVGVNERVRVELERGLAVFREYFVSQRESAEQVADAIAGHWELRSALAAEDDDAVRRHLQAALERYRRVARIVAKDAEGRTLVREERSQRLDATTMRLLRLKRHLPELPNAPVITVTVVTPAAPFDDYQRAGELVEVYSRLEAGGTFVSWVYLVVYAVFLLSVIAGALAVGILVSRRVTRRVAMLAGATARVGAGDLSVEVPSHADDEIGDLTRAFNRMVRDIRESRSRIEYLQRIGAWQEFARRLAHEIKNPLTPIQLAMQEVHRSYKGDDERYRQRLGEALSIIEEEVATLRHLVGEFSSFAKLPQVRLAPADLNDVVRDAIRSLAFDDLAFDEARGSEGQESEGRGSQSQCRASVGSADITCELWQSPLHVRVDAMMFKRCVDNLVRNARQAIELGGCQAEAVAPAGQEPEPSSAQAWRGRVQVRTLRDGDRAVLEVADNGPGIAELEQNRVFDPYYTTKPEGTGLGLAIVKKVVLEHGGEILCGPSPLGGASFRVTLPLDPKPATDANTGA